MAKVLSQHFTADFEKTLGDLYLREKPEDPYKVRYSKDQKRLIHVLGAFIDIRRIIKYNVPGR